MTLFTYLPAFVSDRFKKKPVVPVVRMSGAIGRGSRLNPSLSLASIADPLERAFSVRRAEAVALFINSPGGSPVQSSLIEKRIRALAGEHDKKVLVFVEDVAASGGYWIATAGDEIYADPSSILGSIGVVAAGFGFTEAIAKLGVERRVFTAGERKVMLDPFQPNNPDDIAHLKSLQLDIHQEFIDQVKSRRGDRLSDDPEIFSGLFWAGREAVKRGLADGIGEARAVLREKFGDDVVLRVMNRRPGLLSRGGPGDGVAGRLLAGQGVKGIAGEIATDTFDALEERSLWARYGL